MRVKLFRKPEYDFRWPNHDSIPENERIVIKCKRLTRQAKRMIDDEMVSVKGSRFDRSIAADDVSKMSMGYSIGTMKDMRLRESVTGWENVLDENGDPIKYSLEAFYELLSCNANLDPSEFSLLETDLLDQIESENSFADTTKVTAKNLPESSSESSKET